MNTPEITRTLGIVSRGIASRMVGQSHPCFIVAEIAQAHDGSLGAAHAYIDAVARTGADAIKFQTHIAAAESTPRETFRVAFSKQDATRYDYWKRMEFKAEEWAGLAAHARDKGLMFLSTPFSFEAAALLEKLDMPAWKIGSGETTNLPFIEHLAKTGKPVLLSSGLSSWEDLDAAVNVCRNAGSAVGIYQCTTAYPCPPEKLGLNVMADITHRYQCPVGLSDHSGTPHASLAAVALGANMLELHVTFSRECFGPDVPASVTIDELKHIVEGTRFIEKALAHPVDKEAEALALTDLKTLFGKSVVAARALPAGHVLTANDLALKKPGNGMPAARLPSLVGKRLKQNLSADECLVDEHLG